MITSMDGLIHVAHLGSGQRFQLHVQSGNLGSFSHQWAQVEMSREELTQLHGEIYRELLRHPQDEDTTQ